jgi:3-oxoacyl-[acyl-carrier protein] reductase
MAGKLNGKVAVVTGASKGIGASIALHLAAEGAAVVVNYSSDKRGAERVVGEINGNGGRAVAVQADVSREGDVQRLFAEADAAFGRRLDVLVNNAGVYEFKPLDEVTPDHFHRMFDLNVLGLLLASREAARRFGPEGGSIINVGSVASRSAPPTTATYSATKGAVDSITRSLSQELGPKKVRVNSLNPGMVDTEGVRSMGILESDFRKQVEAQTPLGRVGVPADIATVAVFLATDDAKWISGETLFVAGGLR